MFISLNGDASAFSDINTQPKDKVNIHRITAYKKIVHKTTPTPYFGEKPGRQPGQNIINAPLSTKNHSTPANCRNLH